jgi:hypothetical protein
VIKARAILEPDSPGDNLVRGGSHAPVLMSASSPVLILHAGKAYRVPL